MFTVPAIAFARPAEFRADALVAYKQLWLVVAHLVEHGLWGDYLLVTITGDTAVARRLLTENGEEGGIAGMVYAVHALWHVR